MQLKMWVLSGAALALWLTPLTVLDKRINWHKSIQGLSLCAAIACAVGAGKIASQLADENEIEFLKIRAIKADVEDEIATEVYVSQKQRQQEAELILNPREQLERALALTSGDDDESEPIGTQQLAAPDQNTETERAERALQLKAKGWGKAKIILEIWGISKGGSPKYKAAEAQYEQFINQQEEKEE
ncbi:hypothetical protein IQ269_00530 [Tychonema sp. LEGE 07199]|uniref:hypothetical protein n=1 Tax=unclassified Tychonema TaxID=2642144 RepID=UPI00187FFC73|nr:MULTISPECIES: hypothetical protein [unclassified Tychonema]MBE9119326.1 hypothetical protein [Tychonema sp. LEGE 07199]MBE9130587.1 hypothetical protein [Tychonema sp. LEGE 07196]